MVGCINIESDVLCRQRCVETYVNLFLLLRTATYVVAYSYGYLVYSFGQSNRGFAHVARLNGTCCHFVLVARNAIIECSIQRFATESFVGGTELNLARKRCACKLAAECTHRCRCFVGSLGGRNGQCHNVGVAQRSNLRKMSVG